MHRYSAPLPLAAAMATYPSRVSWLLLLLLHAHIICLAPLGACALSFSYNFSIPSDLSRAGLKYIGDSSPSSDSVDLTATNKQNSSGRVVYPQTVRLWDGRTGRRASFNTSFSFAIIGGGISPNSSQAAARGDGMAFFIGPPPTATSVPPGSSGAFLGLFNSSLDDSSAVSSLPPTVAVEFDTNWDPRDVAADHVGIDVNNISPSSYTRDLAKGDLSGTMSANITYDASSMLMVVTLRLAKAVRTGCCKSNLQ